MMLNNNVFLSEIFSAANDYHCCMQHSPAKADRVEHRGSYDVCRHWLCRIAFFVEKWLWYGGEVG
jgi:hypothetical protein